MAARLSDCAHSQRWPERRHHVLPLSARNEVALGELARRYCGYLEKHPEVPIEDVAYTAGVGRLHMEERAALMISSPAEAQLLLGKLAQGETVEAVLRGRVRRKPKTAWLFTGLGSQYVGMGRTLYETQPVVREVLDRCSALLEGERERPLLEALFEEGELLVQASYSLPALYALEVAMAHLLKGWGLEPEVVLGHGVGEYAAAVVAGVLSLEDGLRLIAKRGELIGRLPADGATLAVFADLEALQTVLANTPTLSLIADNGVYIVLGGPKEVVGKVMVDLTERGVRSQRLDGSHILYPAPTEPIWGEFEALARRLDARPAERTLICNLTGKVLAPGQELDAGYWIRHTRGPVQFRLGVRRMAELGVRALVDLGPEPVLFGVVERCWPEQVPHPALVGTLRRGQQEGAQIARAVAQLYVNGLTPDFAAWDRPWPRRRLALPTYPFQRQRYCLDR